MKKIKKLLFILLLVITLIPSYAYAYSDKVILGGENIGIRINTSNIIIVGFYKVNGHFIANEAGLEVGDNIIKINNDYVYNINDMLNKISNSNSSVIEITILRNQKEHKVNLELFKDNNGVLKSGIYVKDTINGIGSLTYIDPNTMVYGALGHNINSKYTYSDVKVSNGSIFKSLVTNINKGKKGEAGSKEAKLYPDNKYGNISTNTDYGIFGKFTTDFNTDKLIDVGNSNDIKLGKATIRTVIDSDKEDNYDIEIINIDYTTKTKNILFKVTDDRLIKNTGGIIAGMSGSPIIQNNKLIGAVTHVVLEEPNKGYGIFITTMLKEGDNIFN